MGQLATESQPVAPDGPVPSYGITPHAPFVDNGESVIDALLSRRGIEHWYERVRYPLYYQLPDGAWRFGAFCPDFHLPATTTRAALNIEVTFADHGRATSLQSWLQANRERLELKRAKIELTAEHYRVETILITYAVYQRILRDERYLDRLIKQAVRRHHRRARLGTFRTALRYLAGAPVLQTA